MSTRTFLSSMFCGLVFCITTGCRDDCYDSIVENKESQNIPKELEADTRTSSNPFIVSMDDAECFASSFRRGESFTIDPYVIEQDTLLFLVNYEEGWLLLAGDKRLSPVAAESEKGHLKLQTPNKALFTWMDSFADEVRTNRDHYEEKDNKNTQLWSKIINKRSNSNKTRSSVEYKWAVVSYTYLDTITTSIIVDHLIPTKWGQGYPWNVKLPVDLRNNIICPLGCTAVSLSQILYYTHYHLGKPTGFYHNVRVNVSHISAPTSNIGFSRTGYSSNSPAWDQMALDRTESYFKTNLVGDLMLDVGYRVNMTYSSDGSYANITPSVMASFNLSYSQGYYDYSLVKNSLENSCPVNVTAFRIDNTLGRMGHSWIIDGVCSRTYKYITEKRFEYTENWMHESEYYDSFDDLRFRYHINSEYDCVKEETYNTSDFLLMNWGYDGDGDDGYYSVYPSIGWSYQNRNYNYDKKIHYNFR